MDHSVCPNPRRLLPACEDGIGFVRSGVMQKKSGPDDDSSEPLLFNVFCRAGSPLQAGHVLDLVTLDDAQGIVAWALNVTGVESDVSFGVLDEQHVRAKHVS